MLDVRFITIRYEPVRHITTFVYVFMRVVQCFRTQKIGQIAILVPTEDFATLSIISNLSTCTVITS